MLWTLWQTSAASGTGFTMSADSWYNPTSRKDTPRE